MSASDVRADNSVDNEIPEANQEEVGWPTFFLERLERLLGLRDELEKCPEAREEDGAWKLKVLHRAIYSCYCDCLEHEVGDVARQLFHAKESNAC